MSKNKKVGRVGQVQANTKTDYLWCVVSPGGYIKRETLRGSKENSVYLAEDLLRSHYTPWGELSKAGYKVVKVALTPKEWKQAGKVRK